LVFGVEPLGDDAFEAVGFYGLDDLAECAGQGLGEEDAGFAEEFFECGPAFAEWAVLEVLAVQVEQVEGVVGEGPAGWQERAVLQHLEGWFALGVDGDGFAVEDEGGGFYFGNAGGDFGELAGKIVSAAGIEADFVGVFNGLEAVAVEF
jgi:hypothetical protein